MLVKARKVRVSASLAGMGRRPSAPPEPASDVHRGAGPSWWFRTVQWRECLAVEVAGWSPNQLRPLLTRLGRERGLPMTIACDKRQQRVHFEGARPQRTVVSRRR